MKIIATFFLLKIELNYTICHVDNYLVIKLLIPIANYLQALPN